MCQVDVRLSGISKYLPYLRTIDCNHRLAHRGRNRDGAVVSDRFGNKVNRSIGTGS